MGIVNLVDNLVDESVLAAAAAVSGLAVSVIRIRGARRLASQRFEDKNIF